MLFGLGGIELSAITGAVALGGLLLGYAKKKNKFKNEEFETSVSVQVTPSIKETTGCFRPQDTTTKTTNCFPTNDNPLESIKENSGCLIVENSNDSNICIFPITEVKPVTILTKEYDIEKENTQLAASHKEIVDTTDNNITKTKKGSLIVEQGGKFSESEKRAAKYMSDLGNNVILRIPKGTRVDGCTSDLLVNGINYDVYTPITTNPSRIISAIADKKNQATGIIVDLSQTSITTEQLGNIKARLLGKGVNNITDIIILK